LSQNQFFVMSIKNKDLSFLKPVLKDIKKTAGWLWEKGWAEKNGGNVSVNVTDLFKNKKLNFKENRKLKKKYPELGNEYFLFTAAGSRMRSVARKPADFVLLIKIGEKGDGYEIVRLSDKYPDLEITSEAPTHFALHQSFKQNGAPAKVILHTHPTEVICMTQNKFIDDEAKLNKKLWSAHPETIIFLPEGAGFVKYMPPGIEEIAVETAKKFKNHKAVVWEKHGVFSKGEDLYEAFDYIDLINKSAEIWLKCKAARFEPEGFTEEQLNELKKLYVDES